MILGIGNDMVDCRRIEKSVNRYGSRFINRIFTFQEQGRMNQRADSISGYARLFAMKEAVLKALGTGLANAISWQDIEIFRMPDQAPRVELSGAALKTLHRLVQPGYKARIHISVSDEWPYAQAFAIMSADPL